MAKFVSNRDFEFFQHINREVSSEIVDTLVILYKLNLDHVNTNIYGESTEKISYTGVEVPSFVDYQQIRRLVMDLELIKYKKQNLDLSEGYFRNDIFIQRLATLLDIMMHFMRLIILRKPN